MEVELPSSIKNYKLAFTVTELILSLMIIGIVVLCSLSITFNKNKIKKRVVADSNAYYLCYEGANDLHGVYNENIAGRGIGGCDFYVLPKADVLETQNTPANLVTKEFVTITLTGGGAGMGNFGYSGNPGEQKTVVFPSIVMPRPIGGKVAVSNNICNSLMCSSCGMDGTCTKCITGYKLEKGVCKLNFKYRAILGQGGAKGKNGGQTSLLMVDLDTGKVLGVVETASGGFTTSAQSPGQDGGIDSQEKKTGSAFGSGNGGYTDSPNGKMGEVKIEW